ncbi:MAG: TonB family protein [Bacteroidia bacterium]|nr:TonB family protein [Bacteroidia bacterium]
MQPLLMISLALPGLYLGYRLVFYRVFHPQWQRRVLVFTLLASVVLPWIPVSEAVRQPLAVFDLAPVTIYPDQVPGPGWGWRLEDGYYAGLGICLFVNILGLGRVGYQILRWPRGEVLGQAVILTGGRMGTSSFGRWIFWDETRVSTPEEVAAMIAHEQCHIRQRHSLDALLCAGVQVLCWFHPVIYLIRQDLSRLHEYLADHEALRRSGLTAYRRLLIAAGVGVPTAWVSPFHTSFLKQRINMLQKSFSHHAALRALIWLLCAGLVLLTVSACTDTEGSLVGLQDAGTTNAQIPMTAQPPIAGESDSIQVEISKDPVPLNLKEIREMIGYPAEAANAGIQGMVVCRVLVGTNGEYVRHLIINTAPATLQQEVEKHLSKLTFSPALDKQNKPVKIWVNIPFNFVLAE